MAEQIERHGCEVSNAAQATGQLLSRITAGKSCEWAATLSLEAEFA